MRSVIAAVRRAMQAMVKSAYWVSVGGRLVLQPVAALIGMSLFTEDEVEAGLEHVSQIGGKALGLVGGAAKVVGKGVAGVGRAAVELASLPGQAVGSALRTMGGNGGPSPDQAAAEAEEAAKAKVATEERSSQLRSLARSLQRVLDARLAGEQPPAAHLGRLPKGVRNYVMELDADELQVAAGASKMAMIAVLSGQGFSGCRAPSEVRADTAMDRRAQLIAANAVKPTPAKSANDILAELEAAPRFARA